MTADKVRQVVALYRQEFHELAIPAGEYIYERTPDSYSALAHCHEMLAKIEDFAADGQMDKAFRWLGFVQGCLWAYGVYTIDQMRQHNKA
jgi:hypothetical protein